MSLRKLAEAAGISREPGGTTAASHRSALVFVLNRRFLPGLKVLAYTLIEQGTLLDLPVLVLSDDHDLADDPFVRAFADRFIAITPADIAQFADIPAGGIHASVALDGIPAYTFLKWLVFDDFGFDQLIWIDADIMCLAPVDHLVELTTAPLHGGTVAEPGLLIDPETKVALPPDVIDRNVLAYSYAEQRDRFSLNSGVMVINRPLLNKAFRDELIAHAKSDSFVNEQTVIRRVLYRRGKESLGWLRPWDNYKHGLIARASPKVRERLLADVRLMHFVGAGSNPWERPGDRRVPYVMWWAAYQRAKDASPLFREAGLAEPPAPAPPAASPAAADSRGMRRAPRGRRRQRLRRRLRRQIRRRLRKQLRRRRRRLRRAQARGRGASKRR